MIPMIFLGRLSDDSQTEWTSKIPKRVDISDENSLPRSANSKHTQLTEASACLKPFDYRTTLVSVLANWQAICRPYLSCWWGMGYEPFVSELFALIE